MTNNNTNSNATNNGINRRQFLQSSLTMATVTGLGMSACTTTAFNRPLKNAQNTASNMNADKVKDNAHYPVIIIGTGYGSAVTALRLAEAGIPCLMLEMGLDWQLAKQQTGLKFSSMAWAEKQSTWLRTTTIAPFANYRKFKKFTGALDRIDFQHINVYAGRGVGGGSLVNGGMSVTPRKDYFAEIFPTLDTDLFYAKYFPLANAQLGVHSIPDDFYQSSKYYQFSRIGESEGVKAGYIPVKVPNVYDYDYMQAEQAGTVPKSALKDEVIYGNNYGKKDLTKTYLKQALATGKVTIVSLYKVEQLIENNGNIGNEEENYTDDTLYSLKVKQINTQGETIAIKTLHTDKLFLGAGSLGTTELLLKSHAKGTLTRLDSQVGKHWGNNGNVMATRSGIKSSLGRKQSSIPAVGLSKWTDDKQAIFVEVAPFPIGIDLRMALYLAINRVEKTGTIGYDTKDDKLTLDWDDRHNQQMVKNTERFLDEMNNANGGHDGSIFSHIDAQGKKHQGVNPKICYHPLGGCVLGKATDKFGRLNNYQGIYITDGSLIPASIGVNPYVTITALAEYCVENVLAEDFVG